MSVLENYNPDFLSPAQSVKMKRRFLTDYFFVQRVVRPPFPTGLHEVEVCRIFQANKGMPRLFYIAFAMGTGEDVFLETEWDKTEWGNIGRNLVPPIPGFVASSKHAGEGGNILRFRLREKLYFYGTPTLGRWGLFWDETDAKEALIREAM